MKKYMVVYKTDCNETGAVFRDTYGEAKNAMMDMCVSLGWYAELYARTCVDEEGRPVFDVQAEEEKEYMKEYVLIEG